MAHNTLDQNDYYSQRNNAIRPASACNVTSCIMALCQAGYYSDIVAACKKTPKYSQPEDCLMAHLHTPRWMEHAESNLGPAYKSRPEECWATLVAGLNNWIGKSIAWIDWTASFDDIIEYVNTGHGIVCGGSFTPDGHFVNVGGADKITATINDPWGNFKTGYKLPDGTPDKNGYGVELTRDDFSSIVRGPNNKGSIKQFFAIVFEPEDPDL